MGEPKYKLGVEVKVKKFPDKALVLYQVSCGDGRKEPHYWARVGDEKEDYEFEESEIVPAVKA
jgi:hypothetical protein